MNNQLIQDYQNGKSLKRCSEEYNLPIKEVKRILLLAKVHIRNRQEQNMYNNQLRGYTVNHQYFNKIGIQQAYYLGFLSKKAHIATITNNIKIQLSATDKEWLEEFRTNVGIQNLVNTYTNSDGYEIAELQFASHEIKKELYHYGVKPTEFQNNQITMAELKTDKLKWAFIKGVFDAAGKITHHSEMILPDMGTTFSIELNNLLYGYEGEERGVYSSEVCRLPFPTSAVVLTYMYMLDTPYLERKREHAIQLCDNRIEIIEPRVKAMLENNIEKICSSESEKTDCKMFLFPEDINEGNLQ